MEVSDQAASVLREATKAFIDGEDFTEFVHGTLAYGHQEVLDYMNELNEAGFVRAEKFDCGSPCYTGVTVSGLRYLGFDV